jgi:RimJ/RimL family protein N-acetyltransferase
MNWIQHPVILEGDRVRLIPLDHSHIDELANVAADERIWEHMSVNCAERSKIEQHLKSAILKRATGEQYPFTVVDKATGKLIGSTFYHNIVPEHKKLEIGWTWYAPLYWRTGYNRECKLAMLTHCFETLKTIRVQLITDINNRRSYNAILGIGASLEGVLRNERIRANGEYRNSAMFSIISSEWEVVKEGLVRGILESNTNANHSNVIG